MTAPVHSQARLYLADRAAAGMPPTWQCTPSDARKGLAASSSLIEPGPSVARVRDILIPGRAGEIPARVYDPAPDPPAVVVYYHGGGWVIGSVDDWDVVCRVLAVSSGCCLVSVDYRLAPEHRFPAAVDDAYDAMAWASSELAAGRPVVLAGDSAGGNLAAVTALRARDSSGPPVALQVLVYPVTDHDFDRPSYHSYDSADFILNRRDMMWYWDHYLPDVSSRSNPYASPLRDEGFAYADRLSAARVPVEHRHYGSQIHAFFTLVNVLDDADKAVAEAGAAIRAAVES